MYPKGITVITFTLNRKEELERCIQSVKRCKADLPISHLIFSKHSDSLQRHLGHHHVHWVCIDNLVNERPIGKKMAQLRNEALKHVQTNYCAFLDDDNTVDEVHFQQLLVELRTKGCDFAFSHRKMFEPNGKPFSGDRYPWMPSGNKERLIYQWCVSKGIITRNSQVICDGYVEDSSPHNVSTVDMNEWLFDSQKLLSIGFDTNFSKSDYENNVGEDDKLLKQILSKGFSFSSSKKATVNYYLGGNSNF